jgi:hypothetical protein
MKFLVQPVPLLQPAAASPALYPRLRAPGSVRVEGFSSSSSMLSQSCMLRPGPCPRRRPRPHPPWSSRPGRHDICVLAARPWHWRVMSRREGCGVVGGGGEIRLRRDLPSFAAWTVASHGCPVLVSRVRRRSSDVEVPPWV